MTEEHDNHVQLPRARVGGLKKGPVEDLLKRIARDYAQLEVENRKLWETIAELREPVSGRGSESSEPPADAAAREEPTAFSAELIGAESRREMDELATAVLGIAHRAANDLRESTRLECELMLKKARAHADEVERELERSRALTVAELEELAALKRELREQMRSSLQAVLRTFVAERSGELPILDWREPAEFFATAEPISAKKKKKRHKNL